MAHFGSSLRGQHGFAILLVLVIASAVYVVATPDTEGWRLGVVLFQAAIVVAAVLSAQPREGVRILIWLTVLVALIVAGVLLLSDGGSEAEFSVLSALLAALVLAIVGRGLIHTLREEGASERAIAAALAVYLLIGMFSAYVYGAIGEIGDGPLFAGGNGDGNMADQVYYSFITQTTVGYGDLTPEEPVARAVAITQALTGQLYLVTVVALLVGGFLGRVRGPRGGDSVG